MAGIGIKLNKFFDKGTVTGYLAGSGYSVVTTIAPMLLVIADILAMQKILGYSDAAYGSRQLFQASSNRSPFRQRSCVLWTAADGKDFLCAISGSAISLNTRDL